MRRLELLINDVRFNSNNLETNRYTNLSLHKLFNDGQREIQRIIHVNDTAGKYFAEDYIMDAVLDQEAYDLPADVFSYSSINSVGRRATVGGNRYIPLNLLSVKERSGESGYIPQGKKILISPIPSVNLTDGIRINYTRKIYSLSTRIGQISSLASGTSVQLAAGFSREQIANFEDYFCIIGRDGTVKAYGLNIDSYNISTGLILTSSTWTSGAIGDYVVIGYKATTHSELPDICEQILCNFVERKIQAIDSSSEVTDADLLTQEEKENIIALFGKTETDTKYPPITDTDFLWN